MRVETIQGEVRGEVTSRFEMINIKKIENKVEERKKIPLEAFLKMMSDLEELKRYGSKKTAREN